MKKVQGLVSGLLFFILCSLTILLIFENYVVIPVWLWPIGRMHPLLLHFPIVLVVLLGILSVSRNQFEAKTFNKVQKFLLYFTGLATVMTALMGFFLSQEPGSSSELMSWHKWMGATVAYLVYFLILVSNNRLLYNGLLSTCLIMIVFAGHSGAGLTHGTNFLLEPIMASKTKEVTINSPIYSGLVAPVFEKKCQGCHNSQKHKGGLDMSSIAKILNGGENGSIWESGNPDESDIIRRLLLPIEQEDHMPPEGKTQLTQAETQLIYHWIAGGTDTAMTISNLEKSDTLFNLATEMMSKLNDSSANSGYDFDFASKKVIESLNTPYRSVAQITPSSPAISANIYVRQKYKKEFLTELSEIKDQIISLNLVNLPIEDDELSTIAKFKNLEKLILNGTNITGRTLNELKACTNLKSLSLSSTKIGLSIEKDIPNFENLKKLFIWDTAIDLEGANMLEQQFPEIEIFYGYTVLDEPPIKLTPPLFKNKSRVIDPNEKIELGHLLQGTEIRYTIDGSEPDSLSSMVYDRPFELAANHLVLNTKACKENWMCSETKTRSFFRKGLKAHSAKLLTMPHPDYHGNYKGEPASSLIDFKKGNNENFREEYGFGAEQTTLKVLIDLGEKTTAINEIVVCFVEHTSHTLFPPSKVAVFGGHGPDNMTFLGEVYPPELKNHRIFSDEKAVVPIARSNYQYYRIEIEPCKNVPSWHRKAGNLGDIFVDEIFFY